MTDNLTENKNVRASVSDQLLTSAPPSNTPARASGLFSRAAIGLFGLSFFERTAFFTLKYLLILIFVDQMGMGAEYGAIVLGAAITTQYLLYSVSGVLSDRFLGLRATLALGVLLIAPAYLALAVALDNTETATDGSFIKTVLFFTLAMQLCAVGLVRLSGFNLVKQTLSEDDPRSEKLYVLYYWVESIGALMASICAGTFVQRFGWTPVFGTLVIGMMGSAAMVHFNRHQLLMPSASVTHKNRIAIAAVSSVLLITGAFFLLSTPAAAGIAILAVAVGVVVYIYRNKESFRAPKQREFLFAFSIVTIASLLFNALQEQQWSSLVLFADRAVDRTAFGITLHPSHFQSIVPVMLVLLGPVIATLLDKRQFDSASTRLSGLLRKLSVAFGLMTMCFVVLFASTFFTGADQKIHFTWLTIALVLAGPAELFIYPIAFNAITSNVPTKLAGTMSGIHFTCYAGAGFASGALASLAGGVPSEQGLEAVVLNYREFLGLVSSIGVVFVLICIGASLLFAAGKFSNRLNET
ncbi:MAG: MFS transporter [Pseudomonadota bacterium]